MHSFYEDISKLYGLELYDDVITLYELSYAEQALSNIQAATVVSMVAESYYQHDSFIKSQEAFYRAITLTKALSKPVSKDLKFSEADLKYRLHRCLLKQRKREEAMGVLGSIAEEEMTPKVISALARLHHVPSNDYTNRDKVKTVGNAMLYHKKVVELCPEAIDSLSCIVRYGLKEGVCTSHRNCTVQAWLKAQEAVAEQKHYDAISHLSGVPPGNLKILIELGRLHYTVGENQKAAVYLRRAHHLDPNTSYSMDILAFILAQEQNYKDLENLAATLMDAQETPEAWVAYAFLAKCQKRYDKALYFTEKACKLADWHVHPMAILLRSLILMDKKKFDEAIAELRDALVIHPANYTLYEALVHAFLLQEKTQEARIVACTCRHILGQDNARALYLCATLAAKDESTVKDAQKLLEKAIAISPHLLDAVFLLVALYDKTQSYEKAIALLKKQTETTVNSRLHRLLGDFLTKTNRPVDACHQYRLAVDGDASAAQAMDALEGMPGINTPECLTSVTCPGAPRRRTGQILYNIMLCNCIAGLLLCLIIDADIFEEKGILGILKS
ncbi:TPR Domain containing protein [Wuchereria bancrofti]|uniref:TPR Domain containing protein n=1 Tax=Wuchereria bancrofti TaxID=6293 RepID=J9F952_WUCBA|nr:TPR Domain containing protein [Wuchereria bancrofti]